MVESPRPWSSEEDGVLLRLFINLSEVVSQLPLDERWKRWKGMNWTLFAQDHAPSRSVDEVRARFYHYVEAGIGIRFGMPRRSIDLAGEDDLFGFPSSSEATTHIEVNTDMPPAEQQGENGKDGRNQQYKSVFIPSCKHSCDQCSVRNFLDEVFNHTDVGTKRQLPPHWHLQACQRSLFQPKNSGHGRCL